MSKLNSLRTLGVLCVSCGGVLLLNKFGLDSSRSRLKRLLSVADVAEITARDAEDAEGSQKVELDWCSKVLPKNKKLMVCYTENTEATQRKIKLGTHSAVPFPMSDAADKLNRSFQRESELSNT